MPHILLRVIKNNNAVVCVRLREYNINIVFIAPPYGRTRRVRWTKEEKQIVMEHFSDYIIGSRLPSIKAIQEVIASNPCLQNRSASVVKTWINNQQRNNGVLKKK